MSGSYICHFQAEVFNCWCTTLLLPRRRSGKESACQCQRHKRCRFDPWVGKIPWSRKWQPIPVFLPGKAHGQRSQMGYSPWGCKVLDMTEHACVHTHTHTHTHPPALFPLLRPSLRPWVEMVAAAAAKSLQSCLTLCDPIDGSPPGSPIPGILQARTLEWVAISFSNVGK